MTLDDLREKMKAAYPDARKWFAFVGSNTANMRQYWVRIHETVEVNKQLPGDGIIPQELARFHQAGIVYYHAKKHGLKSAAMLKLTL